MSESFERHRRAMATWLLLVCGMTASMVILGGLTRLTHSGLSMTTWSFTGSLPPLGEAAWQAEFSRYQQFPEYQLLNNQMTLAGFKSIFWYEYSHRMLGRAIGTVYLLPMLYFFARRAIPRWLAPRLLGLLGLLLVQGFVGWWMVRSGLVDRPDVSHLRLTTHLGMAFAFFCGLWWVTLTLWRKNVLPAPHPNTARLSGVLLALAGMVYGTAMLGGLVAGLDAGFTYNTFPLMAGRIVPPGYMAMSPWWSNLTENIAAVQFNHRWVAIATLSAVVVTWARARRLPLGRDGRIAMHILLAAVSIQVLLGVTTLLSVVWLPVASAHQAGALALLAATLYGAHVARFPGNLTAQVRTSAPDTVTMRSEG